MNEAVWRAVLDRERRAADVDKDGAAELELEDDETEEELEEEEEGWGDREFVSDVSEDEDGLSDLEEAMVSPLDSLFHA